MNKDKAVEFLKLVTSGKIQEAYDKYVDMTGKHHNPHFPGDFASLKLGMEQNEQQFPNKKYEIKETLEDGDLVAVHGKVQLNRELSIAVVHILKFKNGKIVEMWDIGQEVPQKPTRNQNGMF